MFFEIRVFIKAQ